MDVSKLTETTRRIALINQKGGVGKTTTTVNLGACLADNGARVLMVDLDPQAHLTLHVGISPDQINGSVYDLLTDPDVSALEIMYEVDSDLAVLPAEVDLAGVEAELVTHPAKQKILRDKIEPLSDQFDFVLLDCPPSLGLLTINGLAFAREIIVPMQTHFLALQGLSKLLETVGLMREEINPDLSVTGVVLCIHDQQTNLATEVVADLNQFFEQARHSPELPWSQASILEPAIRRNIKLAECPSFGQTILQYAPWCPGAMDYRRLADNLMDSSSVK